MISECLSFNNNASLALSSGERSGLIYVTGFAKRGLIRAITNIEKYRFEILNAVYLENAQSFFHAILHHPTVFSPVPQVIP